jgi:hypothetical protein
MLVQQTAQQTSVARCCDVLTARQVVAAALLLLPSLGRHQPLQRGVMVPIATVVSLNGKKASVHSTRHGFRGETLW